MSDIVVVASRQALLALVTVLLGCRMLGVHASGMTAAPALLSKGRGRSEAGVALVKGVAHVEWGVSTASRHGAVFGGSVFESWVANVG